MKRRFGISIPEKLAKTLDKASKMLGTTRSSLVEEAIRAYLSEIGHLEDPHECAGVIIATCREDGQASKAIPLHKKIVVGHLHVHINNKCTDIIAVKGHSSDIVKLLSTLRNTGCQIRYLPIPHDV